VGVAVRVGEAVGVAVAVGVGVRVGEGVSVGSGVWVAVGVRLGIWPRVAVGSDTGSAATARVGATRPSHPPSTPATRSKARTHGAQPECLSVIYLLAIFGIRIDAA
jgi:hypothetical protein